MQAQAEFGQPVLGLGPGSVSLRGTWSPGGGSSSRRRLQTGGSAGRAFLHIDSEDILPWLFPLASDWWIDAEDASSSPITLLSLLAALPADGYCFHHPITQLASTIQPANQSLKHIAP